MYNSFIGFKTLLPLRRPSPSRYVFWTSIRKHPFHRAHSQQGSCLWMDPFPAPKLSTWTQHRLQRFQWWGDLLRLKFKYASIQTILKEFPDKIQDISTNIVQTYFFEKVCNLNRFCSSWKSSYWLNPESQVTPAQMVFIFLLQNKTEVKKNQNGNETYIEFPWGDTTANINVRFSV